MWFSVAALRCVICLSCYNDSIICCCLGNRHICSATQRPAMHRCFLCSCVHRWTCVFGAVCSAAERGSHSLMNDKSTRKARHTQILREKTHFENGGLCSGHPCRRPEGGEEDVTYFQSIFSYKLRQTRFVSKHTPVLSARSTKCVCNREELHNPLIEMQ